MRYYLELQNHILSICKEQYTFNIQNLDTVINQLTIINLLSYFVNDTDNSDIIILPDYIFTVLYSRLKIETGNPNIIIKIKPDQSLNIADILKLREIWDFREIEEIPYINKDSNFSKNIISNMSFKFNKMYRIEAKNYDYFNLLELSKFYKTSHNNEINLYSFSLNPLSWKPSGYCNFSYINKFEIKIEINKLGSNSQYDIDLYNRYYNILNVDSGMANLIFFK